MTKTGEGSPLDGTGGAYNFDPLSESAFADPGRIYSELRARAPFYHLKDENKEWWITSDYAEIRDYVLQDNPVWSFKWGDAAKDTGYNSGIVTDPPFHNAFRAVLLPGFTPKAMTAFKARVESLANELVDQMLARPSFEGDLHNDFAVPLPAKVMCIVLGLPVADYLKYKRWGDDLHHLLFHDQVPGSQKKLYAEISEHCLTLVDERRALLAKAGIDEPELHHLGDVLPDDYMARSICASIEGRRLTNAEIVNICVSFITGGQETTQNLIGNVVWRLLQEPVLWRAVQADATLIDVAIEESLRFDPPVLAHFRTSLCPVTMHGQDIPEHAKLMFSIAGANRDPSIFKDPDQFKLERPLSEARKHLSFGSGVHHCIGAPLGRLEGQVALRVLIERLPNLRLTGEPARIESWMYWGRSKLPVAWG